MRGVWLDDDAIEQISVTKKLRPHWSLISSRTLFHKYRDFRNEKVTAPLKSRHMYGNTPPTSNFRNEKVTAPLKSDSRLAVKLWPAISVTKKLRPHWSARSYLAPKYMHSANFRNEKVTAPLKYVLRWSRYRSSLLSNFRNEKVTAPLKCTYEFAKTI